MIKEHIKQWFKDDTNKVYIAMVGLAFALFIACMCSSCAPKVITVTEYKEKVMVDTFLKVDSIWRDRIHTEYLRGDTLFLRDSVNVYKYKYLDKVKEVYVHDSIPYPVEVVKEVHKRSGYDRFVSCFFWIVVAILLCIGGFWVCDKIPACKPYTTAIKAFFKIIK